MEDCVYVDVYDLKNDFEFTIKADNFNDLLIILDRFNRSSFDILDITNGWCLFDSHHPFNGMINYLTQCGYEVKKNG